MKRPRLVGINHVALEVDDIDAALAFYGQLFELEVIERSAGAAFIEIGDQFIALMKGRSQPAECVNSIECAKTAYLQAEPTLRAPQAIRLRDLGG